MQPKQAVTTMLQKAGHTMYSASLATDHKASYISSLMRRKGSISAPVLATIANVCDYDLVLIPRGGGDSIPIDYTTKQDASD